VRGEFQRAPKPTSPSHTGARPRAALRADPWGVGLFLSPLKGGEGFLTGPAGCLHALARKRGSGACPLNRCTTSVGP
jgi:hypothetical protein